jgi:hypothetical protein
LPRQLMKRQARKWMRNYFNVPYDWLSGMIGPQ